MAFTLEDITVDVLANQDKLRSAVPEFDSLGRRKNSTEKGLTPLERFVSKILINPNTGCWEWQGAVSKTSGYGQFKSIPNSSYKTSPHRFIYEYLHGPLPDGQEVDHEICSNRICCYDAHLKPKTHLENMKSTRREFCKHGHAMTDDNVYTYKKTGARYCKKCRNVLVTRRLKKRLETDPEYKANRNAYHKNRSGQKTT